MGRRVVSDFHMAGIVCHVLCLLIFVLVADRIPSASSATAEVGDVASLVASGDNRPLFEDAAAVFSSAVPKTRSIRAAVLPLGHRYIGLGKRLLLASQQAAGGDDHDKRPYSLQDGAAMRFIGLGKRGGPRVVDSGLRFIGLGKKNAAAMRYIGLGKRPFYDSDAEVEEQDMDEEEGEDGEGEDGQEERRSRVIEKRSTESRRHQSLAGRSSNL